MMQTSRFWQFIAESRDRAGRLPPQREFSCVHEKVLLEMFREMSPQQIIGHSRVTLAVLLRG